MQVTANNATEEVVSGVKLYTGLCDFGLIAINPTMEQAKALNVNLNKEPIYTQDVTFDGINNEDGSPKQFKRTRVDFWLRNEEFNITTKHSVFVTCRHKPNKDNNKFQFINNKGNTGWGTSLEALKEDTKFEWLSKEGLRACVDGEDNLINFLTSYLNISRDSDIYFEFEEAKGIGNGNVDILRQFINEGYKVRVLLGVDKNGSNFYQKVYPHVFARAYGNPNSMFMKALNDQYRQFKGAGGSLCDYQRSLTLQEYAPTEIDSADTDLNSSVPGGGAPGEAPANMPSF